MRLFEFENHLSHGTILPLDKHPSDVIELIKNKCSDFLNISIGIKTPIYRGRRGENGPVIIGQSRIGRNNLSTDDYIAEKIDEKLSEQGFTALRSNSIFCTPRYQIANSFAHGKVYFIFPVNGFSFTWSPIINDLTTDYNVFADRVKRYKDSGVLPTIAVKNQRDFTNIIKNVDDMSSKEFVKFYQFKNDDLKTALLSKNELLINGAYIGISKNDKVLINLIQDLYGRFNI